MILSIWMILASAKELAQQGLEMLKNMKDLQLQCGAQQGSIY
jgi:hypothetical protein